MTAPLDAPYPRPGTPEPPVAWAKEVARLKGKTVFTTQHLVRLLAAFGASEAAQSAVGQAPVKQAAELSAVTVSVDDICDDADLAKAFAAGVPDLALSAAPMPLVQRLVFLALSEGSPASGDLTFRTTAIALSKIAPKTAHQWLALAYRVYNVSGNARGIARADWLAIITQVSEAYHQQLKQLANGGPLGVRMAVTDEVVLSVARRCASSYVDRLFSMHDKTSTGVIPLEAFERWISASPHLCCSLLEFSVMAPLGLGPYGQAFISGGRVR
ncbi:hypothetical protein JKP88DRAFT_249164 [Tribonema minus]|uniref:EF-hand domain-containing protein n=1 Tax=Tribonema minus TaxID=303371 RepID=A0A835YNC0_9STRA|nr:hypothetical protein JKP88DRAFT_249164 [Tribonema minus]